MRLHFALFAMLQWGCDGEGGPTTPVRGDAAPDAGPDATRDGGRPDGSPVDDGVEGPDAADPDAGPDADRDAEPDAAAPDAVDAGWITHEALGELALATPVTVEIAPGTASALVQARGRPGAFYAVVDVVGPRGRLTGPAPGEGRWRTSFNPEVAVALWPGADDALEPGTWRFTVVGAGPAEGPVEVEIWRKAGARSVAIDVLYPPDFPLELEHASVVRMARALENELGEILGLPVVATPRALGPGAPLDLDLDTARGDFGALDALAAATPLDLAGGLAVYVMGDVRDGGTSQSGFAGGLPAPFGRPGTAAGVIAVRSPLLEMFPEAVADLAVHELGHGLGLYHTTEPFGDRHDPLPDTPECPLRCDRDGDGVLFASECGRQGMGAPPCQGAADNFMFWTVGGRRDHTPGQRQVLRGHPAVAP